MLHNTYRVRGGEDEVVDAEQALLASAGHEVVRIGRDNARIETPVAWKAAGSALWSASARRELVESLRSFRPDVVHVHNTWPQLSPSVLRPVRAAGAALVATLHNVRLVCPQGMFLRQGRVCHDCVGRLPWPAVWHGCYRGSRPVSAVLAASLTLHRALRSWDAVDAWITLSEASRRSFAAAGWPMSRVHVRPNFTAPSPCPTVDERRAGLLFVGRLSREKGVDVLADAVRRVRAQGHAWRLTVVGDGEDLAALSGLDGVDCVGRAHRGDVDAAMARARALVVPSVVAEHSPRVVIEALASGLPVVGSAIGALPELLSCERGTAGWLVPPGDAEALARALVEAHDEAEVAPAEARARRALARSLHGARHSPHVHLAGLEAIYEAARAAASGQRTTEEASSGRSR